MKLIRYIVAMSILFSNAAFSDEIKKPVQNPPTQKPNIVIIWGDDIGHTNISAYSHGLMGYRTPNIDRVAYAKSCSINYF